MSKEAPKYTLLYHAGMPGRGEYVRLVFEAAGVPFRDAGNESESGKGEVYSLLAPNTTHDANGNPPPFAPPYLKVAGEGKNGGDLLIYQTANIMLYLGLKFSLAGDNSNGVDKMHVNELALTALDLGNETHNTHHPISTMDYYEDQKDCALQNSTAFRKHRLPKFFGYFEKVLKGNKEGQCKYLVGSKLTYADTTLWHAIDGLYFAFPKEMEARKAEFPVLLKDFYASVKEEKGIREYLASGRRLQFSNCLWRHYPELDLQ